MPKRKTYSNRSNAVAVKYRKKWRRKTPIPKQVPLGFPQSQMVRLKYVDRISLDPDAVLLYDQQIYRANDMNDPYWHVGGHQPRCFDQWMLAYNHFTVVGAKVKVTPLKVTGNNTNVSMVWGVALTATPTDVSDRISGGLFTNLLETRMIGTNKMNTAGMVYNLNKQSSTCTVNFSAKKYFKKQAIVGDSLYRGAQGVSPSEEAFFIIWGCPPDGASNSDPQSFLVEIEYIAVLTEPKPLAGS